MNLIASLVVAGPSSPPPPTPPLFLLHTALQHCAYYGSTGGTGTGTVSSLATLFCSALLSSCVSETRFLIDFRQTTDLKNATRYEQKKKRNKKEAERKKKQLKSQEAKKKRRNDVSYDDDDDVHTKCQARATSTSQPLHVSVYTCVLPAGGSVERVACVDCDSDCDADVANLDLDLETRWRFVVSFFLFASLLFFSSFFLHVSWHEVLKSKACIVWVVASLCVCVCVGGSYRIWCYVCIEYRRGRGGRGSISQGQPP